jgi:hypothetical protein
MQVQENPLPQENPAPNEEIKKKRKRRKKQHEEGDSIVDGCLFDGCYFVSWMPWDFDGGCLPDFDGGCFDIGDGCNIGDGCSFDGCSMIFLPFRLMIILGLMAYGDWDYKAWKAKM